MQSGQKSYGSNGKQNMLFPLAYMYLAQGESQYTLSHDGTYAMDFWGWNSQGRLNHCPYFAPFDCTLVEIWGKKSPMIVWQSDKEVNFVDGTQGYATIGFCHDDDTPRFKVGEKRRQGEVIGHTGTYGKATGDHVHIEVHKGKYDGYMLNTDKNYMLKYPNHLYSCMGVNDTTLVRDYYINHHGQTIHYDWRVFSGVTPPPGPHPGPTGKKPTKGYPWYVITSKKLHRM